MPRFVFANDKKVPLILRKFIFIDNSQIPVCYDFPSTLWNPRCTPAPGQQPRAGSSSRSIRPGPRGRSGKPQKAEISQLKSQDAANVVSSAKAEISQPSCVTGVTKRQYFFCRAQYFFCRTQYFFVGPLRSLGMYARSV